MTRTLIMEVEPYSLNDFFPNDDDDGVEVSDSGYVDPLWEEFEACSVVKLKAPSLMGGHYGRLGPHLTSLALFEALV